MKLRTLALIAALVLAPVAVLPTLAVIAPASADSRRAEIQQELQTFRADIEALRTALQGQDKAAAEAAFTKVKADWVALPPAIKQRIIENHPVLAKLLELRADVQALRAAFQDRDQADVQSDLEKLKADLDALPPKLQQRIEANHPLLDKLLNK